MNNYKKTAFAIVALFVSVAILPSFYPGVVSADNGSPNNVFNKNLYAGMSADSDVMILQQFLTTEGVYSGPITGNFFSLTYKSVKQFQSNQGITPASGYFGPITRAKANAAIAAESQSAAISNVSASSVPSTSTVETSQSKTSTDLGAWLEARVGAATDYIGKIWGKKNPSLDVTPPTVTLSSVSASITSTSIPITVTFSESVNGFTLSDVVVSNGAVKSFSGSGSKYYFVVTPAADGIVSVDIPANVANDTAGNPNTPAQTLTRIYDHTPPVVSGLLDYTAPSSSVTWTWSSEAGATFRYIIDTNPSGAPSGSFSSVTTASKSSGTGTYYIHVQAKDVAGNTGSVTTAHAVLGNTPPPAPTPTPTPTPPPSSSEIIIPTAYTTSYTYYDNTPPGSADISNPILHQKAGGTGTYADPITIAVGHSIINGSDILDYPAGTKFYIPNVRRYFIVEDTCGDGKTPQNGPCHTGYPRGTTTWLDMWIDGQSGTASSADACASFLTDSNGVAHTIIENPASNYVVVPGPVFENGVCTLEYGNTPVTN